MGHSMDSDRVNGGDPVKVRGDTALSGVYVGTQGFSPRDWVGTFYPPSHPQRSFLDFYGQVFNSVELNTTFYAIPPISTVMGWAQRTPPEFVFTAKMPKLITHEKQLLDAERELQTFEQRLSLLGSKLGAVVIQFPRSFTRQRFEGRLRAFLPLLPRQIRFAVEFRSQSWQNEEVFDLLRQSGVAWCVNYWQDLPTVMETTTDVAYFRLVGHHDQFTYLGRLQHDRSEELAMLADNIVDLSSRLNRIYVYVNNHFEGHAPATATRLKRLLGLPTVDPRRFWPHQQNLLPGMEPLDEPTNWSASGD
jgi:uncharacterized protein YecE (DUF72 family)